MMSGEAHADTAINDVSKQERNLDPRAKAILDARCKAALKTITQLMQVRDEYTEYLKEEKPLLRLIWMPAERRQQKPNRTTKSNLSR